MGGIKLFALMGEIGVKGIEKVVAGLKGVSEQVKKTSDGNKKLGNSFKALQEKVKASEDRLKNLKDKYSNVVMQEGKNSKSAKALQKEMLLLNNELKKDKDELDRVSKSSDKFTTSLDKVENKSGAVRDKLSSFANGVTGVGKAMTGFITTGVGAIAGMGLAHNVEIEKMEANLAVLLGSSEKAEKKLEELRTMGAKTPFETKDLMDATQKMLAFGIQSDKTNGYLQMLGDISMGDAQKLDSLTLAFSQISAGGKASMEDINQMIDAGFNPLNYIAGQTGESMTDLRDRVSKGKVSFEEIAGAMEFATSKGQPFYKSMQTASETTSGKISTLKDNFSTMIGELTESLLPVFQKVVDKASTLIEKFSRLSDEQKENILKIGLLVGAIGPLLMVLGGFINLILNAITLFKNIKLAITGVKVAMAGLNLAFLSNPITWVIAGIVALVGAFIYLWNTSDKFRAFWIDLWQKVKQIAGETWQAVTDFFSNAWATIQAGLDTAKQFLSEFWQSVKQGVIDLWNGIVSVLTGVATWIYNTVIKPVYDFFMAWIFPIVKTIAQMQVKIIEIVVALGKFIVTWILDNVVRPIIQGVTNLYNKAKAIIQGIWSFIVSVFGKAWAWVNDNVLQPILQAVTSAFNKVKAFASNLWQGIKNVFSSVGSFFGGIFRDAYNRITSVFSSIGSFFSGIWNRIRSTFSGLGTSIGNSISGAVRGALNGVINAIENTINRGIGLINGAIGLINKLPGVSVGRLGLLRLPRLFRGGVLERGQVGLLEGNGAEAVVPLENNKKWLRALGEEMQNVPSLTGGYNNDQLEELIYLFKRFVNTFAGQQLVLDTGVLVGELAPGVNRALAKESDKNRRGR